MNDFILDKNRRESHQEIKKHSDMHRQAILIILAEKGNMSAREIAQEMHQRGLTVSAERNHALPRLTELYEQKRVKVVGKKTCTWTGRSVSIWGIVNQ